MLLCFTILVSSLSFNFLFIIKKNPLNLPFGRVPTLTKQHKTLLLSFFYLLPIV